ncbi:MAG: tRNA (adenosine(37)-N6)-threonylcarbamoyltransferase complex transferase subunit TsaD [Patescibacteria group bacterium]|nr:tRNA (adenosine(37)-N6)-threonylcarbamoyltransferase complex transferase subunit TsaD [Patescibacteria group bacterium]
MIILGIETSCDETALALLEIIKKDSKTYFKVLGDVIHSQVSIHKQYGGVVPMIAKREHAKNLKPLLEKLIYSPITSKKPDIDAIAVTYGPGLEPALWVGIDFAKKLGELWNIPVIPTNHMEGHIVASLVPSEMVHQESFMLHGIQFPAIALLISGGHTELILIENWMKYKIIGQTRDDAVGEAFDKVARLIGLPYPGGPQISKIAKEDRFKRETAEKWNLPRPMMYSKDYDFSFSGLKTAVLYTVNKIDKVVNLEWKEEIAREFEDAVVDVLVYKTNKAVDEFDAKTLIVGGGVIANDKIREALSKLSEEKKINSLFPTSQLSTDNALMIALAGYFNIDNRILDKNFKAIGNLKLAY